MISQSFSAFLVSLGSIILVDLVLSGDNALVIGAALTNIPSRWRRFALIGGGAGAILARIVFTTFATFLLRINYLQAIGGVLVLYIACQLVFEQEDDVGEPVADVADKVENEDRSKNGLINRVKSTPLFTTSPSSLLIDKLSKSKGSSERSRFIMTIITVVIADITMSLDNIVAIGALANGQLLILGIGLLISIIILLVSSAFVALLIERIPGLIFLAAFILAWISGNLVLRDVQKLLPPTNSSLLSSTITVYLLTFSVVSAAVLMHLSRHRRPQAADSESREVVHPAKNR